MSYALWICIFLKKHLVENVGRGAENISLWCTSSKSDQMAKHQKNPYFWKSLTFHHPHVCYEMNGQETFSIIKHWQIMTA